MGVLGAFSEKYFLRGVGHVDGAFDAVTKAEFLGQFDGETIGLEHAAVGADALDEFAAVMRKHLCLHGFHDIGPAQVNLLRRGRRGS